jgi:hypothetical protein
MKFFAMLVLAQLLALSSFAQTSITSMNLKDHLGDSITIIQKLTGYELTANKSIQLYFGEKYPNQLLTAIVPDGIAERLSIVFDEFVGQDLIVDGVLSGSTQSPIIKISNSRQLAVAPWDVAPNGEKVKLEAYVAYDVPYIYINDVQVPYPYKQKFSMDTIASFKIVADSKAMALNVGKRATAYFEGFNYAKKKNWAWLSSVSSDYKSIVPTVNEENDVLYIVNKKPLLTEKDRMTELASARDEVFKSLEVLSQDEVINSYHVTGKKWGVVITTGVE